MWRIQSVLQSGFISSTLYKDMVGEGWSWFASRDPENGDNNFFVRVSADCLLTGTHTLVHLDQR